MDRVSLPDVSSTPFYAPVSGIFRTGAAIGERITVGQPIAWIGDAMLHAPLAGTLRGLTRDGVSVKELAKVIEVDPRLEGAIIIGIDEQPAIIARGVLAAM